VRDLITSTGRVARRGETKTGFSISVNDHETIAALAKAIAGEIVTHWARVRTRRFASFTNR